MAYFLQMSYRFLPSSHGVGQLSPWPPMARRGAQSCGTTERSDANITALNSGRLFTPCRKMPRSLRNDRGFPHGNFAPFSTRQLNDNSTNFTNFTNFTHFTAPCTWQEPKTARRTLPESYSMQIVLSVPSSNWITFLKFKKEIRDKIKASWSIPIFPSSFRFSIIRRSGFLRKSGVLKYELPRYFSGFYAA